MNTQSYTQYAIGLVVAVILIMGVVTPIMANLTTDEEGIHIENEGAMWIRMTYIEDASDYSVEYAIDNGTVTVTDASGSQSGELQDMILYADEKASIFVDDSDVVMIAENDGETGAIILDGDFTVSRSSGVLTVTDNGGDHVSDDVRAWAYVPKVGASYGVFDHGVNSQGYGQTAVVGFFAGVYTYNDMNNFDLPIVMEKTYTDDYISSVRWVKEGLQDLSLDTIPIIRPGTGLEPFNPIDTNATDNDDTVDTQALPGMGENVVMAVPTPTYTDGYWGYEYNGDGATIVSYSGSSGNIVMPDTVGGRTVLAVGKGGTNQPVFNNSQISGSTISLPDTISVINSGAFSYCSGFTGSLVIPDSVTNIGNSAFTNCSGFTGSLVIPDSVTNIGTQVFYGCSGFTGSLVIPDTVTNIGDYAFMNCSGFTGSLVIPDTVTNIGAQAFTSGSSMIGLIVSSSALPGSNAFSSTTNLKQVLNLSTVEYTTTSYGLNADEVRTDIEASLYMGVVGLDIAPEHKEGIVYDVLPIIPLIMVVGVVLFSVWMFIRRY